MNTVVEKIKQRQKSVRESLNSLRSKITIENIPSIKLSDFAHLDCAIQVYSEILDSDIWFCSNEEIANEAKEENPNSIAYTVKEILDLIKLNPRAQELRKINDIKALFRGSKVISSKLNTHSPD